MGRKTYLSRPHKIDPIEAYKLRYQNGLTFCQIGKHFGVKASSVVQRLQRLSALMHSKEQAFEYEAVKPQLLSSVEQQLLASLASPDKIEKATLNNVAYAFTQIHMAKRLEENKSTANVGILSKLVKESDETLFSDPKR